MACTNRITDTAQIRLHYRKISFRTKSNLGRYLRKASCIKSTRQSLQNESDVKWNIFVTLTNPLRLVMTQRKTNLESIGVRNSSIARACQCDDEQIKRKFQYFFGCIKLWISIFMLSSEWGTTTFPPRNQKIRAAKNIWLPPAKKNFFLIRFFSLSFEKYLLKVILSSTAHLDMENQHLESASERSGNRRRVRFLHTKTA